MTRERLYIETMEKVLSNSSKVVLDVEEGNNLMMLPLDQMAKGGARVMGQGSDSDGSGSGDSASYDLEQLTDRVVEQIRSRDTNSSRRGR